MRESSPTLDGQRSALRLKGEISLHLADGVDVELTGLDVEREGDDAFRLTLRGALEELRKLAAVRADVADLLARVADQPPERSGTLRLLATPSLLADLARETPEDALPQEWMESPAWVRLAFALDRYEPEAVGVAVDEASIRRSSQ